MGTSLRSYLDLKKKIGERRTTNVVDLIKRAKIQESQEKKHTLYIVAATASALAITGIVIAL